MWKLLWNLKGDRWEWGFGKKNADDWVQAKISVHASVYRKMDHTAMNQFRRKWGGKEKTENVLRDNVCLQRACDRAI